MYRRSNFALSNATGSSDDVTTARGKTVCYWRVSLVKRMIDDRTCPLNTKANGSLHYWQISTKNGRQQESDLWGSDLSFFSNFLINAFSQIFALSLVPEINWKCCFNESTIS